MEQRVRTAAQQDMCKLLLKCAERLEETILDMSNIGRCLLGQANDMDSRIPHSLTNVAYASAVFGIGEMEYHLLFGWGGLDANREPVCRDVTKDEVIYNVRRLVNGEAILPYNDGQRRAYANDRHCQIPADTITVRERMKFNDAAYCDAVMPELKVT